MGTYRIRVNEDKLLEEIQAFCGEEGLGCVSARQADATGEASAATTSDWQDIRCSWTWRKDAGQAIVEMRTRAPAQKMAALYLCLCMIAIGLAGIGIPLLVGGLDAMPCVLLPLLVAYMGVCVAVRLKWNDTVLEVLSFERRFAARLLPFVAQVERPAGTELIPFTVQIGLMLVPMGLLLAGVTRGFPPLSIPIIPWVLSMIARAVAEKSGAQSPFVAWRLLLSEWLSSRYVACYSALLAVALFMLFGAVLFLVQKPGSLTMEDFRATLQLRLDTTLEGQITHDALASDVTILGNVLAKPEFKDSAPRICLGIGLVRALLGCLCVVLFYWNAQGLIDWLRRWGLTRSGEGPALSPPPVGTATLLPVSAWLGILLSIVFAIAGNILHLALTVEAASVLFLRESVLNFTVAQTIGWMVLDLDAASKGQVQLNAIGLVFLSLLLSPTLLTVVGWLLFAVRSSFAYLRTRFTSADAAFQDTAVDLAASLGTHPPNVCIVKDRSLRLEILVPWFWGRPTLLISRATTENLSEAELTGAIAHEVVHVRYDMTAVRWTRWLSFLSFFPCNVFALLLDTEHRERRADSEAARLVGSAETVSSALVKVSLGNLFQTVGRRTKSEPGPPAAPASHISKPRRALSDYLMLFGLLLQPELALGYVHPRLEDRVQALDRPSANPPQ